MTDTKLAIVVSDVSRSQVSASAEIIQEVEALAQEIQQAADDGVSDSMDAETATSLLKRAANIKNVIEKARKQAKEPVLALGSQIDNTAKSIVSSLMSVEAKLNKSLTDYLAEKKRKEMEAVREAEAKRIQAINEARRLEREREEQERALLEARSKKKQAEIAAELERNRQEQDKAQQAAEQAMELADNFSLDNTPSPVKEIIVWTIDDVSKVYKRYPHFFKLVPEKSVIDRELAALPKGVEIEGMSIEYKQEVKIRASR